MADLRFVEIVTLMAVQELTVATSTEVAEWLTKGNLSLLVRLTPGSVKVGHASQLMDKLSAFDYVVQIERKRTGRFRRLTWFWKLTEKGRVALRSWCVTNPREAASFAMLRTVER